MSKPDEEEERADTMQQWRSSPVTRRLLELATEKMAGELRELLGACEKTSCPVVGRLFERYRAASFQVEIFGGKYD